MKDKLPCAVVRDLLPSYIDGLTSEETKTLVEAHLESCPDCRAEQDKMRGVPIAEPMQEEKMIDFLKKTRLAERRRIFQMLFIIGVVLLGLILLIVFVLAAPEAQPHYACSVHVVGGTVSGAVTAVDPYRNFTAYCSYENGVVTITPRTTREPRDGKGTVTSPFSITVENKPIHKVMLLDRVVWEDGLRISELADAVYKTRHADFGDAAANEKTADALQLMLRFGDYTSVFETAERPYVWILRFGEQDGGAEKIEAQMRACAYVLLVMIDDLDAVHMEYTLGEKPYFVTVSAQDASNFAGTDVKSAHKSLPGLQALLELAGLR